MPCKPFQQNACCTAPDASKLSISTTIYRSLISHVHCKPVKIHHNSTSSAEQMKMNFENPKTYLIAAPHDARPSIRSLAPSVFCLTHPCRGGDQAVSDDCPDQLHYAIDLH
ncbi:hypothetical protein V6N13_074455 [Hibiscus sabdariffa]